MCLRNADRSLPSAALQMSPWQHRLLKRARESGHAGAMADARRRALRVYVMDAADGAQDGTNVSEKVGTREDVVSCNDTGENEEKRQSQASCPNLTAACVQIKQNRSR